MEVCCLALNERCWMLYECCRLIVIEPLFGIICLVCFGLSWADEKKVDAYIVEFQWLT